MASTENNTSTPAPDAAVEVTINTKPSNTPVDNTEKVPECTCKANMPELAREDSIQSSEVEEEFLYRRPPPPRRVERDYRRYSPSPIRRNRHGAFNRDATYLDSSTSLVDQVNKHDGMVELPMPSRGSIYLTTYPFTDSDVKKWSWLFSLNVQEKCLQESSQIRGRFDGDSNAEEIVYPTVRRARNHSPYIFPNTTDIPSVYLSRALDKKVIPEDTANVTYFIVIENRHLPNGSKLLIAESRKAAAIKIFYEAMRGDSIVFVGATVGFGKKRMPINKFKRVESLEEAAQAREEGFVGIVC